MPNYPLRHLSIRVPWHDAQWNGTICNNPRLNGSCLRLENIARYKDDAAEQAIAGRSLEDLTPDQFPCCVPERVTFMADFEFARSVTHPYAEKQMKTHRHFRPTTLRHPAYSAPAIPYHWMLKKNGDFYNERYSLGLDPDRDPDLIRNTAWWQERSNQKAVTDCFFEHLRPQESLCFFYAKQVPFVEDVRQRVIVGVGRVLHVGPVTEYSYEPGSSGLLRAIPWERLIQHSIRPNFRDGFLLPYHAAMQLAEEQQDFDPATLAALAPEDRISEFSYGSEHVTHDGAITGLLACAQSLQRAKESLAGPWEQCLQWIDSQLALLWKLRGPCPGLGAVLRAFGVELGTFVAREVDARLEPNSDPWPLVDQIFQQPQRHLPPKLAAQFGRTLQQAWQRLPDERRAFLKLLSRFEITPKQAQTLCIAEERRKAGIVGSDREFLENPYRLYEATRLSADPVSLWTVDRGVFPDASIRERYPLPAPTALDGSLDGRRVRALTVASLERAALSGNTLLPRDQVIQDICGFALEPACEVSSDIMPVVEPQFPPEVELATINYQAVGETEQAVAYQLTRLHKMGQVIQRQVQRRLDGRRHSIDVDWMARLDEELGRYEVADSAEADARQEKAAALAELAQSRFSVLIGPAGTGKTTLLSVLCREPSIAAGGVLALAPTGKARVKLESATQRAYTLAQFLNRCGRFDGKTQRYQLSEQPPLDVAQTVIVDEASMLTEEMLAALFNAIAGVKRLILVGDSRQLPPIGPGRPLVDIVAKLSPDNIEQRFPRVGDGYAELTVLRRHTGPRRDDLQFANWFSGQALDPGEDAVFADLLSGNPSKRIQFVPWDTPEEFNDKLLDILVKELKLRDRQDCQTFDCSLGGTASGDYTYFNSRASEQAEAWQILSPVRGLTHGVDEVNRLIHKQFKSDSVDFARKRYARIPKPLGLQEIVYGDKVINVVNHKRGGRDVYPPDGAAEYIANGEIGIAIGQFRRERSGPTPRYLHIEFSSQVGYRYSFKESDFKDESGSYLELAYCLTIHKAQGSEFGTVILVLPNPCRLLSRELIYTALTRQKERVVILHQGDRSDLKQYTSNARSDTARRFTNLFAPPQPVEVFFRSAVSGSGLEKQESAFLESRLIHRTSQGEAVRSKSEVIIADRLAANGLSYSYEKPLKLGDTTKYPDFTIEDDEMGITYYWEHCGLLHNPDYRQRWQDKQRWYREHGILPLEEGGGENGTLIATHDSERGGISSQEIQQLIESKILA